MTLARTPDRLGLPAQASDPALRATIRRDDTMTIHTSARDDDTGVAAGALVDHLDLLGSHATLVMREVAGEPERPVVIADREQARYHACVAARLDVDRFLMCADEMHLVQWKEAPHRRMADDTEALVGRLGVGSCTVVPISAFHGDDVMATSVASPWCEGATVLEAPGTASAGGWAATHGKQRATGARLSVQWVLHPTRSAGGPSPSSRDNTPS